ncbi:hypothetical protein [Nonomuraea dietziae]|uniref:hypothetical protein n=1 Tax=Nonomuraea dietziae TaxID=65515 RepID=UPI0033E4C02F
MSTPSGDPPKNATSAFRPAGTVPANTFKPTENVYKPGGGAAAPRPTAPVRVDPGFFRSAIAQIKAHHSPISTGLLLSGFGLFVKVLMVFAVLNMGNPAIFVFRRDDWKQMLGYLKGSAWDVWLGFFSDVSPYWNGYAVGALQQYLRFKLIGMFDQLGAIAKDASGTMHGQYKEVLEYDLSMLVLWKTYGPVFKAATPLAATPLGRVAMVAQAGVFVTALGNQVSQFSDVFNKYEGDLNDLELKLTDLVGAFYNGGNPERGARDLTVTPRVSNPDFWKPVTQNNQSSGGNS